MVRNPPVIVGAGSAGCVLAARLTEDADVSVLIHDAALTGLAAPAARLADPAFRDTVAGFEGCVRYGNNTVHQYTQREANKLILEGATPWDVDRVVYDFEGFLWPVQGPPRVNRWIAGVPVPIRFELGGDVAHAVAGDGKADAGHFLRARQPDERPGV